MSDLKNLKGSEVTHVTIKYKNFKGSGKDHAVAMARLHAPWQERAESNRLETSWRAFNRVLHSTNREGRGAPFPVEERAVPGGTGKVQLKWKVWTEAKKMLWPYQTEHYAVMRAEEWYIGGQGYKKTMSKYALKGTNRKTGKKFYTENVGIDSFFSRGTDHVVCESKFTSNESDFAEFKGWKTNPEKKRIAWGKLNPYVIRGQTCRQMSWEWIEDRAVQAARKPAGIRRSQSAAQNAAIVKEVKDMYRAIRMNRESVARVLNFYGSSKVPVLPGVYKFRSTANGRLAVNQREYTWTLDIEDAEFLPLGDDFDEWCAERSEQDAG